MPKRLDITGETYGKLTAIRFSQVKDKKKGTYWIFKCSCKEGRFVEKNLNSVRTGKTSSCGCIGKPGPQKGKTKVISMVGKTFGHWRVLEQAKRSNSQGRMWKCQCKCKNKTIKEVSGKHLRSGKSRSCGCSLGDKWQDNLSYKIEKNGCWTCTSHKMSAPANRSKYRRLILEKELGIHVPKGTGKIVVTCGNKQCINPKHLKTPVDMLIRVSKTLQRTEKTTPNKRIEQIGLIKAIQKTQASALLEGHIVQTPGPGKVAINYCLFERLLSNTSKYFIVEREETAAKVIRAEIFRLNKKLSKQEWSSNVLFKKGDVFRQAGRLINKGERISFVDACLCATPISMIEDNILASINYLCHMQKNKQFFLSVTFSLRDKTNQNVEASKRINNAIKNHNGKVIYDCSYRDGAPMRTLAWHIQP